MKSILVRDIAFILLISVITIILKLPIIHLPYTEDGATYTINSALWIYDNHIVYPLIKSWKRGVSGGCGHPTLLFNLLSVLYYIFGYSLELTHLVMILFGCITLCYTYLLGSRIYNRQVGFIASILLLFTPLFFTVIGQLRIDVPLMAFSIMAAYYAMIERPVIFAIVGSLLVLSKEPGTFV
ncbi:glycosyltransferase family 39 protein, partial [bacterium]|nr:glycosyltransferase family 39 protein [bacterium]